MRVSAFALALLSLGSAHDVQVHGGELQPEALLRKEPPASLEEEGGAVQSTKSPNSDFDSSSQVWKQIRARANVTAEEPFAAAGPPSVVYTAQTASAAATLIIALTSCFVGLFGLTQAGEAVQKATWKTLDLSLSFLCALLLYFVVREITNLMVSDGMQVEEVAMKGLRRLPQRPPAAESGTGAVVVALLRFFVSLCVQQAVMVLGRSRRKLLLVTSSFGAQLLGLLGADAFATWQEAPTWSSLGANLGFLCITVAILAAILATAGYLRDKAMGDASPEEKELCLSSDRSMASLSLSLPLVQLWRYVLAGRLPHFLGLQRSEYERSETAWLSASLPCWLLAAVLFQRATKLAEQGSFCAGLCLASQVFAYSSAWAMFFCAKWIGHIFLTSQGVATAGQVMKAETYSLLLFLVLQMSLGLSCQLQAQKREELKSCLLLVWELLCFSMCLSWSSTFQMACAFSKDPDTTSFNQIFARCTQCQWMCIVLIFAWLFFIHPRVHEESKGAEAPEDTKEATKDEVQDSPKQGAAPDEPPEPAAT